MKATMSLTVSEIAVQNPRTVRVFESFGIDYCCGGKRPLQEACELAKVPLEAVLGSLAAVDEQPVEAARNWRQAEMRELIQHIVEEHHGYIRRESPRLILLLQKVVNAHKAAHPEVKTIQELFAAMSNEMSMHMMKEENMLFPLLSKMEAAVKKGAAPPQDDLRVGGSSHRPTCSPSTTIRAKLPGASARSRTISSRPRTPARPTARSMMV